MSSNSCQARKRMSTTRSRLFALTQRRFGLLAFGDVLDRTPESERVPLGVQFQSAAGCAPSAPPRLCGARCDIRLSKTVLRRQKIALESLRHHLPDRRDGSAARFPQMCGRTPLRFPATHPARATPSMPWRGYPGHSCPIRQLPAPRAAIPRSRAASTALQHPR